MQNSGRGRLILGIPNSTYMNNHKMGVVAMLFGTGELMLAVAMNGMPQIGMFFMAGFSYFVMAMYFRIHQVEEHDKEARIPYNNTFKNLEEFR